jgi:hypothetical protein
MTFFRRAMPLAVMGILVAGLATSALAAPLEIVRTPQMDSGSIFNHNTFFRPTQDVGGSSDLLSGTELGWFTLDPTADATQRWYDPETGDLFARFLVFGTSAAINADGSIRAGYDPIATVTATGSQMRGAGSATPNFADNSYADPFRDLADVIIGTITWSFSGVRSGTALHAELGGSAGHRTTAFADWDYYPAFNEYLQVNGEDGGLTVLGANGDYQTGQGTGNFVGSTFGVTLDSQTGSTIPQEAMPEPGTIGLLATGLLGLVARRRRKMSGTTD